MTKHKNYVRKYHPYYSKSVNIQLHPPDIILFFTRILAVVKIEKVSTLVLWSFPVNGTDHSLVYHKYFLLKINVGVSKHWSLLLSTWIVSSCSQWHIHSLGSDCGCHIWWLSLLVIVFESWLQKKKKNKKGENNLYSKVYSNDFCYAHTFYKQPNSNPVIKVLILSGSSLK